jgi:hypothetical protein
MHFLFTYIILYNTLLFSAVSVGLTIALFVVCFSFMFLKFVGTHSAYTQLVDEIYCLLNCIYGVERGL